MSVPREFWGHSAESLAYGPKLSPEDLDLAVWPIFERMTHRGICVDASKLFMLGVEVASELDAQTAALRVYAGRELNPHSWHDVSDWLGEQGLGRKRRRRGKYEDDVVYETDERALSQLVDLHPVPGAVLECRGLRKLLTTFIEPVLEKVKGMAEPAVHPRWRLTKVKSGRPSMEDPNLLAFPARDEWGRRVRDCFVARPGHMLVSVDYSQVEPRVAAALSQDATLMDVFASGRDLYADMARRIFRNPLPTDAEFKDKAGSLYWKQRQPSKIVLLGCTLYGMQAPLLHDTLIKDGCGSPSAPFYDLAACEDFVRRRFEPYPALGALYAETSRKARAASGWVHTAGGRGRFLPALLVEGSRWPAAKLREEAERQAFNHLVQGTAQEIMKAGMLRVDAAAGSAVAPLLQIYDEMVYEVPDRYVDIMTGTGTYADGLPYMMATEMAGVKIVAEASVARTWGGLK